LLWNTAMSLGRPCTQDLDHIIELSGKQGLIREWMGGGVSYSGVAWLVVDVLILAAPPAVHEGDDLSIGCPSRPWYHVTQTCFYKDNRIVQSSVSDSEFRIQKADGDASGTYSCSKTLFFQTDGLTFNVTSRDVALYVKELFSSPKIKVIPGQVREGDHMTITCDTELRPHRETTELQFAFYRNGHNVQGFSLSNQYGVPSAQLEDSGNYTCEVQTPSGSVRKGIFQLMVGSCGFLLVHVCSCWFMCVPVGPCWFLWVPVGSCVFLWVPVGSCGFLLVHVCSCGSLLVHVGPCWFMCVPVGSCVFLMVPVGSCGSLLVPLGFCGFLLVPVGSC
uniref:Ig-like domain-containing protein n=1 Tax=Xenopus tropicalis TaxID=8364 RepID=L7N3C6_XENTR